MLNNDRKIGLIEENAQWLAICTWQHPNASDVKRQPIRTVATSRQHRILRFNQWAPPLGRSIAILVALARDPYCARSTLETEMATGTTKGYGFIQPSGGGGGRDVFVHISAVERAGLRSLNEGQTVEYEIESNRGKESAVNLKIK